MEKNISKLGNIWTKIRFRVCKLVSVVADIFAVLEAALVIVIIIEVLQKTRNNEQININK